ncbi:MAG TPA: hypothetical protein VHB25_08965 [Gemmatimonadaceae bacterium]|nr:hypothetical protein [Gemmatimonadaceae bacterium]
MRLRTLSSLTATVAIAVFAYGCGLDSTTAPAAKAPAQAASHSLLGGLLGTATTVTPLQRTSPLPAPLSTSATLGILGGTLSIPGAGITVVVPPLALSGPTTISVTALAGSNVAYEFAPHGIRFHVPLVVTQNLANTQATSSLLNPLSMFVGYFPDASNVTSVTELLSLGVNLLNQTATFNVWHFSGYIIATGRSADE